MAITHQKTVTIDLTPTQCDCASCRQLLSDRVAGELWLLGHSLPAGERPRSRARVLVSLIIENAEPGDEEAVYPEGMSEALDGFTKHG